MGTFVLHSQLTKFMKTRFYKYQGTGNDFIMIDDRSAIFPIEDKELIASMCHRRFGIGADGLILLRESEVSDFEMVYFNADGAQSSMCGNGGRCIVAFAAYLKVVQDTCTFIAIDGLHEGLINGQQVSIKMKDVQQVSTDGDAKVLDTGSPHFVMQVESVDGLDVKKQGSAVRYNAIYSDKGINVNFVEKQGSLLKVATYERGVEDETYSCGTGVVAAAIALGSGEGQSIMTKGGMLEVKYAKTDGQFHDVWLTGPAVQVFSGNWK